MGKSRVLWHQFADRWSLAVCLGLAVSRKHSPRPLRTERQRKAVRECHVRWRRVCGDANRNGLLPHVEPERAMKVIPYGQTAGPVRIRFLGDVGMVNAVKTWRHDDASHEPLNANRQFDI